VIETSPFDSIAQDEGKLSLRYFESKKKNLENLIKMKCPDEVSQMMGEQEIQSADQETAALENDSSDKMDTDENQSSRDAQREESKPAAGLPIHDPQLEEELKTLRAFLKYYTDGITFIKQIESIVPHMIALLSSNTKGEVVEAMKFFVMAHRFEMECAEVGYFHIRYFRVAAAKMMIRVASALWFIKFGIKIQVTLKWGVSANIF
jgi:condensin complex subunit 1